MGNDAARSSDRDEERLAREEFASEPFDEVPAAVVCATCGDPDCPGCAHLEEPTHGSGVVAIVPWERGGDGTATRFWQTAKLTTLESRPFFASLPEGEVLPALRFAVLAELCAAAGLAAVALGVLLLLLPGAAQTLATDANFRELVIRALGWGIPSVALGMVAVHALHGLGLDWAARRAGSSRRGRGLRFGLYACGWDLVTLPAGLLVLLFDEGPRSVLRTAPLSLTVPGRAAGAYLRGLHRLGEAEARIAARAAVGMAAGIVVGTLLVLAAVGVVIAI